MTGPIDQKGGARIGEGFMSSNYTWPFARLSATDTAITLDTPSTAYFFDGASISCIRKYNGLFSRGVQIVHNKEGYPDLVVFWTCRRNKLLSQLRELGFSTED